MLARSKLRLIPFRPFHIKLMELRDWDRNYIASSPDLGDISADYFEKNGMAFTGIVREGIVGAGGLVKIFPSTWEAWALTTPLFEKYGIQIHRLAKRLFDGFFANPAVQRIQTGPIDSAYPVAMRWAEGVGLKQEAVLRKYGPTGNDHVIFARTK